MSIQMVKKDEQVVKRQLVFSIYDEKAEAYNLPFILPQVALAIRTFAGHLQNPAPGNTLAQFPSDFALYHLGTFDDRTGKLESFTEPRFIVRGSEVLNQLKPQEAR